MVLALNSRAPRGLRTQHPLRRGLLAAAIGALVLAGPTATAWAQQDASPTVRSQSSTQMSSAPEVVYVNSVADPATRTQSFNKNWKFYLGDASGAEDPAFDDSSWEHVDVPHDYSIDQDYTTSGEAESAYKLGGIGWYRKAFQVGADLAGKRVTISFDGVYMDATVYVNGKRVGTHPYGYTPFAIDITDQVKVGEQNVVAVKVNHETPSSRWYSGSGIGRDVDLIVTDPVHVARNGMVVTTPELSAQTASSVKTAIATTVQNDGKAAASVVLKQTVFPRGGTADAAIGSVTTQAVSIEPGASKKIDSELTAANPKLWGLDDPNLYTVRTEVVVDGNTVDTYDVEFGFRYFTNDANKGFALNGEPMKIKGVCLHHDQGALGSVSTRAALERQVRILKEMGCNSIRTSHNTPARELIEICNEQGMLVNDEMFDGWTAPKNLNNKDYARFFSKQMGESGLVGSVSNKTWAQFDLEQSVMRDINAPSVIMWSLGNEMNEGTSGIRNFKTVQKNLIDWVQALDTTRPVTTGDNKHKGGSTELNPQGIADANGMVGFNYMDGNRYDQVHRNNPTWMIYGSETASAVNSRGIYNVLGSAGDTYLKDDSTQQLTSYDRSRVGWGHTASQAWYDTITRDFVAGEYVWTGFDYLGEPTPWNGTAAGKQGPWPSSKNSYFGIIDTAGLPKDSYYFYQSQWNDATHTLHVLPAWNENVVYKSGSKKEVPVVVYTDAPEVELVLTTKSGEQKSLGRKKFTKKRSQGGQYSYQIYEGAGKDETTHRNLYLTWMVPFEEGTITAKAYDEQGQPIDTSNADEWDGRQSVTTTGKAAKLTAAADRTQIVADGTDLSYVTIDVCDQGGNIVPDAANKVTVQVEGGTLAGMDNGSSPDHQSFRDNNRKAFSGQLVAIVRSGKDAGPITVTATADGLQAATVTIQAAAAEDGGHGQGKTVDSLVYSRYQYVKKGSELTLPQSIIVRYTDGTQEEKPVAWGAVPEGALGQNGTFTLDGTVDGVPVTMNVTVLEDVAALLNYSTTVQRGAQTVALPASRPAVLADGTIINASFPVTWETPKDGAFGEVGTVKVAGTANVFGKDVKVEASVRVQAEQVAIGANVAPDALTLTQDVPQASQSDTLEAIRDGKTAHDPNPDGGANKSCWTNWQYSQQGHNTAAITFEYATQQRLGQAKIDFFQDTASARWPKAGTTVLEVSEDGKAWTKVATTEKIGAEHERVKTYTYEFAPVTATFVRIRVTNADVQLGGSMKPCTGITEVQLMKAEGSYTTNSAAELDALTVNGVELSDAILASGTYSTRAIVAEVEAVGAGNAAVTVLPAHEGAIKILLESEDHAKRGAFTIQLGADADDAFDLPADDDSRDYPVEKMTKNTAGSEQLTQSPEPVRLAFDKNPGTKYHSAWAGGPQKDMWVKMELPEEATIDALRYLPRQDSSVNGVATGYEVEYSSDGQTWKTAAKGSWENNKDWKVAPFTEPVRAKFFRLNATETQSDSGAVFFSAAEIRLRQARETVSIADADSVSVTVPGKVAVGRVDEQHPVDALALDEVLTHGDKTLTYGVDYLMTFANATAPGEATVTIEGIGQYSGTVERTFTIELKPELAGIAVKEGTPAKKVYKAGEAFDPTGLVLVATMTDGSTHEIAYTADNADAFTFDPAVGTELPAGQVIEVTVGYEGKQATFTVSVAAAPGGDDHGQGGDDHGQGGQPGGDQGGSDQGQKPGGDNGAGSNQGGAQNQGNGGSGKGKGSGLPATGDAAAIVTAAASLAGVGAVAVGGFRRRRR